MVVWLFLYNDKDKINEYSRENVSPGISLTSEVDGDPNSNFVEHYPLPYSPGFKSDGSHF